MKTYTSLSVHKPKKICKQVEKVSVHIIVDLIEYQLDSIISKSIIAKATGSVNAISFDKGKGLHEKISPFNTFIQIIDGSANIVIDGNSNVLRAGEGIIIPAHMPSYIKPNGRFKMLATIIKCGYE